MLHGVAGDLGEAAGSALARRASTSSCPPATPTAPAGRGRPRRARSTRRWSTGRCGGCCARRSSSGCSTRPSTRSRPTDVRPATRREHRRRRARGWPRSPSSCCATTARCRSPAGRRVAVIGPNADDPVALLRLLLLPQPRAASHHPGRRPASRSRRVRDALARRVPAPTSSRRRAAPSTDDDPSGIAGGGRRGGRAPTSCVVVVGDQAGLFGRGTVGEGCDARRPASCPACSAELVEAVLATGHAGRPRAAHRPAVRARLGARRACAAVVQAFFPGEEGGAGDRRGALRAGQPVRAAAGERAPVGRRAALHLPAPRARRGRRRHQPVDRPRPCRSGTGCRTPRSSTTDLDGARRDDRPSRWYVRVRVTNTGDRAGADVVQLYGRDVVGSVTRPVAQLLGFHRVHLEAGDVGRRSPSPCRPRDWPSPTARVAGWWSPASCRCGSAPPWHDRATATSVELGGDVHVVTPRDERWTMTQETRTT